MKKIKLTKTIAKKVLEIVDVGLVKGLGKQEAGGMCIEAAVCFALGLPHGDNPPCVGSKVREFKIALNDMEWPSDKDRTKGMRKLAIAQLGSNEIDQDKFLKTLGFNCMTRVLPVLVENALKVDKDNKFIKTNLKVENLKIVLKELKAAKNFNEAEKATKKIRDIYYAYAYAYAYASAYSYVSAYVSASAYASAYAYVSAYSYSSASASAYSYSSAYVSASASAYLKKNPEFFLKVLNLIAECGLDALKKLKSPGCKWLDLCD